MSGHKKKEERLVGCGLRGLGKKRKVPAKKREGKHKQKWEKKAKRDLQANGEKRETKRTMSAARCTKKVGRANRMRDQHRLGRRRFT